MFLIVEALLRWRVIPWGRLLEDVFRFSRTFGQRTKSAKPLTNSRVLVIFYPVVNRVLRRISDSRSRSLPTIYEKSDFYDFRFTRKFYFTDYLNDDGRKNFADLIICCLFKGKTSEQLEHPMRFLRNCLSLQQFFRLKLITLRIYTAKVELFL